MDIHQQQNHNHNIHLINGYISDENLNQDEVLLVHSINAVRCKNYGLIADLVEKYPYCDIAGFCYMDVDVRYVAMEQDRSEEGTYYINSPPLYRKGPKIATLVTQYGLGKPYKKNKLSQKIVRNCAQESFTHH